MVSDVRKRKLKEAYQFAVGEPTLPECQRFLETAKLYISHPDMPTLGYLEASAQGIKMYGEAEHG